MIQLGRVRRAFTKLVDNVEIESNKHVSPDHVDFLFGKFFPSAYMTS